MSASVESPRASRDLRPLFAPASVAIAGASDNAGKFGYSLARGALRGADRHRVYLLNARAEAVAGQPAYPSIEALPEAPELVVISTPTPTVPQLVDSALDAGTRAFIGITAGFSDEEEAALAAQIRNAGAVLLGPNCLGVMDAQSALQVFAWGRLDSGSVAVISQSGSLGTDIGRGLSDAGVGVSRMVSVGNCADLGAAEMVRDLIGHELTKVIAVYAEDLGDGREFLQAAREAIDSGKPVVVFSVEPSDATARAAMTHTRAILGDTRVMRAALSEAGIVQVNSVGEMIEVSRALASPRRPMGRRIGVVSEAGGPGVAAAQAVVQAGLEVPEFSPALRKRLDSVVHEVGSALNPVDIGFNGTVPAICGVAEMVLESGEVDAVLVTGLFGATDLFVREAARPAEEDAKAMGALPEGEALRLSEDRSAADRAVAAELAATAERTGVALYAGVFDPTLETAQQLEQGGSPVFRSADTAAHALRLAVRETEARSPLPRVPADEDVTIGEDYFAVRRALSEAGMGFSEARSVTTLDEARAAAREIGYPIVLKALATSHKSEGGGVVVGLADEQALDEAFGKMGHLNAPQYSVEEMVPLGDGVEVILGSRWDRQFGPVALVGMGGIYSELLDDVAIALAPLDADAAEALIRSLRGAAILSGYRGRPPLDVRGAAEALSSLSQLAATAPGIAEIEVNPLFVLPDRVVGVDARAVTGE